MNLTDIGCNLASHRLYKQADDVINRAKKAGVSTLIITGSDFTSNTIAQKLANQYPNLWATCGYHPHNADSWNPDLHPVLLQIMAKSKNVVAVGEMGLDYFRNLASSTAQKRCFTQQLEVASFLQKPVFLHMRDAFTDFSRCLSPFLTTLPNAVLHCFTGTEKELDWALAHDLYIGITGWICDPIRGEQLRGLVKNIPFNRLMIETDAPYLAPKTLNPVPTCNEPQYLPEILRFIAQIRQQTPESLAEQTTANALRFFQLSVTSNDDHAYANDAYANSHTK